MLSLALGSTVWASLPMESGWSWEPMKRKVRKELEPRVERRVDCAVSTAAERSGNRLGVSGRGDIGRIRNSSGNRSLW